MEVSVTADRKHYRIGNSYVSLSPGPSKWNKIEHRLFCYLTKNWQGTPLVDIQTVVNLISSTTTSKGLKVKCLVDTNKYELSKKIADEQVETINLEERDQFGFWTILSGLINEGFISWRYLTSP